MEKLKLTLRLNQSSVNGVLKIFKRYASELPYENYSIVEDGVAYGVIWSQPGEPTMNMTYKNGGNGIINIHYEPEGFALLNKKSDMPFDWAIRINPNSKDLYDTVKLPNDFLAARWLKEKGGHTGLPGETNETFFVLMFLCAKIMMTWFGFCMDKESKNGRDLIMTPKKDFVRLASEGWEHIKQKNHIDHLYDGYDTVMMDEKQFTKMAEYVDDVGMKMNIDMVSLDRFAFRYVRNDGYAEAYFYTALDGGLLVVCDSERPNSRRFSFAVILKPYTNPETGEIGYDSELKTDVSCKQSDVEWLNADIGNGLSNWEWLVYSFFGINTFMLNYRDVSVDVKEVECKQSEKVSHGGKVKERTVVKMFRQYTLKKDWKRAVARKKAEYHCLAWSVRGHFRHFKNGKTVYVKPYIKGKEKDKYVPKDYVPIPPESSAV